MSSGPSNSALVVVAGPTGSGKSALAIRLAKTFEAEIVNYDSVQIYQRLDIGSAKTAPAERQGIRHHLLDVIPATQELTAGVYNRLARACLSEITSREKLPILVGGTGFYLRSLIEGLSPAPGRNPDLRDRLNQIARIRPAALHRFFRRFDPAAAARIHANDHQKLIRAIELAALAAPPSPREALAGFRILKIALDPPRADLYARINRRAEQMFDAGLIEETAALLASGVAAQSKSLQSLGYKQAVAVLENRLTRAAAILEVQTKTRQYAKRQLTWFRREQDLRWLHGFGDSAEIQQSACDLVLAAFCL